MKDVHLKGLDTIEEVKLLDHWRRQFQEADLEVPHDFKSPDGHVDTVVATKANRPIASLTAIDSVTLDPFIHDPTASPLDLSMALLKMEAALTFNAQKKGAVDAYIAVPIQSKGYISLLEKHGYHVTVENCVVLRRPLRPETVPLLGPERDRKEVK